MTFLFFTLLLLIYFVPTAVAYATRHHNTLPIFVLNVFFGWTLIGWVAALIWALVRRPPTPPQPAN